MDTIEQFDINGHVVRIHPDNDGDGSGNPRDADNVGIMVAQHPNYELGDAQFPDEEYRQAAAELAELIADGRGMDFPDWARTTLGATVVKPLWLLDHSGLAMRTGPFFEDPGNWDSGIVGFIFDTTATRAKIGVEAEHVEDALTHEVSDYDKYLQGDVYGYTIETPDGVEVDSCWGFLGLEFAKETATEEANGLDAPTPATEPVLVAAVLTRAQQGAVEHWQSYNVPATWFVGQRNEDGSVEVLALGQPDPDDETAGFVWSIRIDADGTSAVSEATIGEFNTGIDI